MYSQFLLDTLVSKIPSFEDRKMQQEVTLFPEGQVREGLITACQHQQRLMGHAILQMTPFLS